MIESVPCERCGHTCGESLPAENGNWGWCRRCQFGTCQRTYDEVFQKYQTEEYANHLGDFGLLKGQWTKNIELMKAHAAGTQVLDIGFLDGSGISAMTEAGFDCYGFDVSDAAFQLAVKNGIDPNRLKTGTAYHQSDFGRTFDVVTCREVIEHVPDAAILLNEIAHSLNENGIAQIQTPLYDRDVRFWDCDAHLRMYSVGSLTVQAESHGLKFRDAFVWQGGMCLTFGKAS